MSGTGHLAAFIGPMFAGKTTEAFRVAESLAQCKKNHVVWVHNARDVRSEPDAGRLFSHGGMRAAPCQLVVAQGTLRELALPPGTTHVILDEVQFYAEQEVLEVLARDWRLRRGLFIYAFALSTDYRSKMWPATRQLLEEADAIAHLTATCEQCGGEASKTALRAASDKLGKDGVLIGGAGEWMPLCAACYAFRPE